MEPNAASPAVAKISGSLADTADALHAFWTAVATMRTERPVVVVHGGGKQATALAQRLGHTPRFVQGRRVTSDVDLDVAQWALRGKLNTQLVAQAQQHDLTAVGLSGADGELLRVSKRPPWTVDGETVDFGWVGDVEAVDPTVLRGLLGAGVVPVVAPLGIDADGQIYNVNADTIAQRLATALRARALFFVTATGGVRRRADDPASRLDVCTAETFATGVDAGWINGGMRVKLHTALEAVQDGVEEAVICAAADLLSQQHATRVQ
jgi:acetylglutamate kinase